MPTSIPEHRAGLTRVAPAISEVGQPVPTVDAHPGVPGNLLLEFVLAESRAKTAGSLGVVIMIGFVADFVCFWSFSVCEPSARAFYQEEPKAAEPALRRFCLRAITAGKYQAGGLAQGSTAHPGRRLERTPRRILAGHQGERLVRRQRRGLGARSVLARRSRAAGIRHRRPRAQGQGSRTPSSTFSLTSKPTVGSGPIGDSKKHKPYDVWPLFPLFKALMQYQQATGDPRIIPALLACCRKIDQVISNEPLYSWAKLRAADLAVTLYWLYEQTGEPLGSGSGEEDVRTRASTGARFTRTSPSKNKAKDKKSLENHGVNTAMALKYGGVRHRLSGDAKDKGAIFSMLDILDRYHGQATGIFTCDEHLAGRSPSQGTELCTVVEAMYSLEVVTAIIGDARLGDRLEMLAFNALPATFKKDMTAHQYDQQCNQVVCTAAGEHVYVSNEADSNLYGLEPNFGCCTANMHQGWPKFASHLWMRSADGGLAAIAYAPCVIDTIVAGQAVRVEVSSGFELSVRRPR